MKFSRVEEGDESVIDVSSLVDIMFILIIFFMVAMTIQEDEHDINVNLPNSEKSLSSAAKALIINVRQDGSYYLGSRRMDLTKLEIELKLSLEKNANQKVVIRGDKNSLHGSVAAAISSCKRVGIKDGNIAYSTSNIN